MKNEKICFNKSVGVIATVITVLGLFAFTAFRLSQNTTSTSTRATSFQQKKNISSSCFNGKDFFFGMCIEGTFNDQEGEEGKFCPAWDLPYGCMKQQTNTNNIGMNTIDSRSVPGYIQFRDGNKPNSVFCGRVEYLDYYCRPKKVIEDYNKWNKNDKYCKAATNANAICMEDLIEGTNEGQTDVKCPILTTKSGVGANGRTLDNYDYVKLGHCVIQSPTAQ